MLIYDHYDNIPIIERSGIQEADLGMLKGYSAKTELNNRKCMICGNEISSHIATFSYRKSFRANSFPNIWKKAEEMLSHADRWVFIGYSLPDADYEFKQEFTAKIYRCQFIAYCRSVHICQTQESGTSDL
jgi:hypothetical protein